MIPNQTVWVFFGDEGNGEGIVAVANGNTLLPLVCLYEETLPLMKENARQIAKQTGKRIRLARFTARENVEDIWP